ELDQRGPKQRSRDATDDSYLAAALAARAEVIISYDKDLPVLRKPFGIVILRPAQLLRQIKGQLAASTVAQELSSVPPLTCQRRTSPASSRGQFSSVAVMKT